MPVSTLALSDGQSIQTAYSQPVWEQIIAKRLCPTELMDVERRDEGADADE